MADRVRLGVVGCGVIGPSHMKAAAEASYLDLVAVADSIQERAQQAAEKYGARKVYASAEEVIADPEIDAVVFAVAAADRTESPLAALAAGKHILLEKPVAMSATAVKRLLSAGREQVMGCCSCRFQATESWRVAKEFVSTGALGPLRNVHCRALVAAGKPPKGTPPDWRLKRARNGGGILVNWGCYDLDYLLSMTGWSLRPKTVLAQTWQVPPRFLSHVAPDSDAETHFAALVRCEDGTIITIERGEYMPARTESCWQVVGTDGTLHLMMTPGEKLTLVHDDTSTEEGVTSRTLWEGGYDWQPLLDYPVQDFARAILEGRPPATSLERALVLQQLTDAIYASAEGGKAVEVG
jgi:predicted dehydrogenase